MRLRIIQVQVIVIHHFIKLVIVIIFTIFPVPTVAIIGPVSRAALSPLLIFSTLLSLLCILERIVSIKVLNTVIIFK